MQSTLQSTLITLAKRLLFGALVLLFIIYLTHFGLEMAQGTTFRSAVVAGFEKTFAYLDAIAHQDWGMTEPNTLSLREMPIEEVVPEKIKMSFGLLGVSMVIAVVAGISFGAIAAQYQHSQWSTFVIVLSIIGVSVPSFFLALLLQLGLTRLTKLVGHTILPVGGFGWDVHIILPAIVLAARPLAQITRITFVTLKEQLGKDYVRTAFGKGLRKRTVMNRHVIKNAAIPILTTIGLSLRFALSSLPVVEFFFGWPGLGFTLLKSISHWDEKLTTALVISLGLIFIVINMLLEIAYQIVDPRLRNMNEQVIREDRDNLIQWLRRQGKIIKERVRNNPIKMWWQQRTQGPTLSPFASILEERGDGTRLQEIETNRDRKAWLQGTIKNPIFLAGSFILILLLGVILFSSQLAPHSPYTTRGLTINDGELSVPPFEPGKQFPWGTDVLGRDMMSLILTGAQQTMLLASLVVFARLAVGVLLGALAGWFRDSWLDRALIGLTEILNAFPTLLLAMLLILAIGIRKGMFPFVITLCVIGWGEIMQYVRSQVIKTRPEPFIESAKAVGQRSGRIISKHIFPNIIPGLITITALEMGAVLMLLGELGFIGIFIGGGAFAQLDIFGSPYHYSDVPEWGALLSNVRAYAQSYPWTAIYPTLAFFVSILGFNLFGEGVRNLIESVGASINRIFNRYTAITVVLLGAAFIWYRGSTNEINTYVEQARTFHGEGAWQHIEALSAPSMEGRALGTPGVDLAADYIADQFKSLGLQAAGEELTYFQTEKRSFYTLDAAPTLTIEDGQSDLVYLQDFVEFGSKDLNMGSIQAPIRVLAMGDLTRAGNWFRKYVAIQDKDYSDEILLLTNQEDYHLLDYVPRGGVLIISDDEARFQRRHSLSTVPPDWAFSYQDMDTKTSAPTFWISEETANRLLAPLEMEVSEFRELEASLEQDEIVEIPLQTEARMNIEGQATENFEVKNVIGHLPGAGASFGGASSDAQLDDEVIVVMAQYDTPPPRPTGEVPPAANDNASGVAVMLELIRCIQESGYQPYRTLLFVAYSGEGYDGGEIPNTEASSFLEAKFGFSQNLEVVSVVDLRALGTAQGDKLLLSSKGSLRLANLFEDAAKKMKVPTQRKQENIDVSIVFDERSPQEGGQEAPIVKLMWKGWEATSLTPWDTLEQMSIQHLDQSGRAASLAIMIIGRTTNY
jgi:ABC-type dipeptide/oligopeptide/nickel transport system permease component